MGELSWLRIWLWLEMWFTELQKFFRRQPCWVNRVDFFKSAGYVEIGATDGTQTIHKTTDVFDGYIDPVFETLKSSGFCSARTRVHFEDLVRQGSLSEALKGFSCRDFDNLRLTQAQFVLFCKEHGAEMRFGATHGIVSFLTERDMPVKEDLSNLNLVYAYLDRNDRLIASHRYFLMCEAVVLRAKHKDPYRFVVASPIKR